MHRWYGHALILAFCLSQAMRDVYFGNVFQNADFFTIVALAFLPATPVFVALTAWRAPQDFEIMRSQWRTIVWMNLTTALAWCCYFGGLKYVEPSVVNTIHSGVGPLATLALGAMAINLVEPAKPRGWELAGYFGIALSIAALWAIVLTGASGFQARSIYMSLFGLALLLCSGTSITISLLLSKKLHTTGMGSLGVTAVRYVALSAIAATIACMSRSQPEIAMERAAIISAAGFALIVAPTFVLQMGIARTPALTGQVFRALGPVFVLALEFLDRRLTFSTAVLVAILAYSLAAIVAAWKRR